MYRLRGLGLHTSGSGSGWLPTPRVNEAAYSVVKGRRYETSLQQIARKGLWPTPRAGKVTDEEEASWLARRAEGKVATPPLSLAVRMWPTPRVPNGGRGLPKDASLVGNTLVAGNGSKLQLGLEEAVRLWPTPFARDHKSGKASEETLARNARPLNEVVVQRETFLTPQAFDSKPVMRTPEKRDATQGGCANLREVVTGEGGSLNPDFVTWLMGWPRGWDSLEPLAEAAYEDDPWRDGEWPGVPRVAKGVPDRVNRLRMLGNGWVPQCVAVIGRRVAALFTPTAGT